MAFGLSHCLLGYQPEPGSPVPLSIGQGPCPLSIGEGLGAGVRGCRARGASLCIQCAKSSGGMVYALRNAIEWGNSIRGSQTQFYRFHPELWGMVDIPDFALDWCIFGRNRGFQACKRGLRFQGSRGSTPSAYIVPRGSRHMLARGPFLAISNKLLFCPFLPGTYATCLDS